MNSSLYKDEDLDIRVNNSENKSANIDNIIDRTNDSTSDHETVARYDNVLGDENPVVHNQDEITVIETYSQGANQTIASNPISIMPSNSEPECDTPNGHPATQKHFSDHPVSTEQLSGHPVSTEQLSGHPAASENQPVNSRYSRTVAGRSRPLEEGDTDRDTSKDDRVVLNIPAATDSAATSTDGSQDLDVDIPQELPKVFLSLLFTIFGFLVTTVSLALTHERMPDYPPLPDFVLDNTPYQTWGLDASEYILIFLFLSAVTVIIFHKYRFVVMRRVFLMLGLLYIYRAICFFVTVLPKADPNYYCSPKLNHTISAVELLQRCIRIISGGGLSINGQQVFCGDFIYSGHTMAIFFSFFIIREYTPRKFWYLHGAALLLAITGIVFLLIGRGHYTIDVIVAYFITSNTWWMYHSMAYNQPLLEPGPHNFFTNHWWFRGFYYFEESVPKRPLPREYNLPLPESVQEKMIELVARGRRSSPREGYQEII